MDDRARPVGREPAQAFEHVQRQLGRVQDVLAGGTSDALVHEIDVLAAQVQQLREAVRPAVPPRQPGVVETLWRTLFGG